MLKEDLFIDEIEIWGVQENVTLVLKDSTEQITSFTQKVTNYFWIIEMIHCVCENDKIIGHYSSDLMLKSACMLQGHVLTLTNLSHPLSEEMSIKWM